ncbi:hypothetical protein [Methylobacter sp. YRD-M1]|uniref:hypothetical protein n=1 Tax=Methylobacter sp. YRD-M1 TaxID=2911520 RepID=UPI00227C0690|nr:hypothetical protein [Methylobacter sp. YRD-M1]WAK03215.1 hypothetical protein LZ558_05365 [Methylobacter sp. YRD-M1]
MKYDFITPPAAMQTLYKYASPSQCGDDGKLRPTGSYIVLMEKIPGYADMIFQLFNDNVIHAKSETHCRNMQFKAYS